MNPPKFRGFDMIPRLRDEDRLAVDLLLDRAAGAGNGNGHAGFTPVNGAVHERLAAVESVLHGLDLLPVDEPPADLMARTMRRVEAVSSSHEPAQMLPPELDPGTFIPHA